MEVRLDTFLTLGELSLPVATDKHYRNRETESATASKVVLPTHLTAYTVRDTVGSNAGQNRHARFLLFFFFSELPSRPALEECKIHSLSDIKTNV